MIVNYILTKQKDSLYPRGVFGHVQSMTYLGMLVRPFSLLLALLFSQKQSFCRTTKNGTRKPHVYIG
jgi:hypothetical protein